MQGLQVCSLVGELRSHMLCGKAHHPPTKTPIFLTTEMSTDWIIKGSDRGRAARGTEDGNLARPPV